MKVIIYILRIIFFISVCFNLSAQTESDAIYYLHKVKPRQTLYAISKQYNTDIENIFRANPGIDSVIHVGQVIKVPIGPMTENQEGVAFQRPDTSTTEKHIVHQVLQGETLYALSKKYQVTIEQIIELNPMVTEGLKYGTSVLIPGLVKDSEIKKVASYNVVDSFFVRNIEQGEDINTLAKQYDIKKKDLRDVNENKSDTILKSVKLPVINTAIENYFRYNDTIILDFIPNDTLFSDSLFYLKEKYKVAIMLPFYLSMNDTLDFYHLPGEPQKIYPLAEYALEFYQGALLAVDSMLSNGMDIDLFVYDTGQDSAKIQQIISNKEFKTLDLIIGPLFPNEIMQVADSAVYYNIPVVSPLSPASQVLNYPNVIKIFPENISQINITLNYLLTKYPVANIVLIHEGSEEELEFVKLYEKVIGQYSGIVFDDVNYSKENVAGIQLALSSMDTNIVVVPSAKEDFSSLIITRLNSLTEDYSIKLVGYVSWEKFKNLEAEYMNRMQCMIPTPYYINYSDTATHTFIKKFETLYYHEPGKYAYNGFDVTYYSLNSLYRYGGNILNRLEDYHEHGLLQTELLLRKKSMLSGYTNKYFHLVQLKDYKFVKVN